jgi:hypothetical protein
MSERYTARDAHPVMTMAGIMPGGTEMKSWYNHVPFPTPAQLALKRAELLVEIEEWKARKALAARPQPDVIPREAIAEQRAA